MMKKCFLSRRKWPNVKNDKDYDILAGTYINLRFPHTTWLTQYFMTENIKTPFVLQRDAIDGFMHLTIGSQNIVVFDRSAIDPKAIKGKDYQLGTILKDEKTGKLRFETSLSSIAQLSFRFDTSFRKYLILGR